MTDKVKIVTKAVVGFGAGCIVSGVINTVLGGANPVIRAAGFIGGVAIAYKLGNELDETVDEMIDNYAIMFNQVTTK